MYRYILQPYKGPASRHRCPQCNTPHSFTFYMDTQTGEPLHPTAGKCERLVKCGYHFTPKQYFERAGNNLRSAGPRLYAPAPTRVLSTPFTDQYRPSAGCTIPPHLLTSSLTSYHNNHFISYLVKLFGIEKAAELANRYYIGTSRHWPGATVFWQIDMQGTIRTGKIMLYSPDTGKRVKQPVNHISWVHTVLKQSQFSLKQCLFGEHLLTENTNAVALVESEKTAIIASAYLPEYTWLATGGLSNLTAEKCAVLKNRQVILYPDLNAAHIWQQKADQLKHIAKFTVSDILENTADTEDLQYGFDLADYLIQHDCMAAADPVANTYRPYFRQDEAEYIWQWVDGGIFRRGFPSSSPHTSQSHQIQD